MWERGVSGRTLCRSSTSTTEVSNGKMTVLVKADRMGLLEACERTPWIIPKNSILVMFVRPL